VRAVPALPDAELADYARECLWLQQPERTLLYRLVPSGDGRCAVAVFRVQQLRPAERRFSATLLSVDAPPHAAGSYLAALLATVQSGDFAWVAADRRWRLLQPDGTIHPSHAFCFVEPPRGNVAMPRLYLPQRVAATGPAGPRGALARAPTAEPLTI